MKWSSIIIIVLVIAAGASFFLAKQGVDSSSGTDLDSFAKCLADNDVKFYGSSWCGHCQAQKKAFGESWPHVNSVECSLPGGGQSDECKDAGITAYPTWEFAGGVRKLGQLTFQQLADRSGCKLG